MSVFAVLYAFIFKVRPAGLTEYKYILLVFSGLVPLLGFSQSIAAGSACLTMNKNLLLNTVFPAELVIVKSVVSSQMPMIAGMIITIGYSIFLGTAIYFIIFNTFLLGSFDMFLFWYLLDLSLISLVLKTFSRVLVYC